MYLLDKSVIFCIFLLCLHPDLTSSQAPQEADHVDTRCSCRCPETGRVDPDIVTDFPKRKIYISTSVNATDCDCEHVVLQVLGNITQDQVEKFCPRCFCKHEQRSLTIIKVVVIIVLWVVSILIVYMVFLLALEPYLGGRVRGRATSSYHPHTDDNEDEDNLNNDTPMRTYSNRGQGARGMIDMVGQSQDKWKKQVEIQRRNIYDRHTMLN